MKRGDIILNRWAGYVDVRYFIYLKTSGRYVSGLEVVRNKISKAQYYKDEMKNAFHDGKPAYKIVGHINIDKVIADILQPFKDADTEGKR